MPAAPPATPQARPQAAIAPPAFRGQGASKVAFDPNYNFADNNNPLNMKLGSLTKYLVDGGKATLGTRKPADGGTFLKFSTLEDGLSGAKSLLMSDIYRNLPVNKATQKWSDGAYDAAELGLPELGGKKVADLTPEELHKLVMKMAHYESGYRVEEN